MHAKVKRSANQEIRLTNSIFLFSFDADCTSQGALVIDNP